MKVFWALTLFCSISIAKPFDFDKQDSGTYIRGNYGLSNVNGDAYVRASGAQTEFTENVAFNWGGELGFMFPSKNFNLRLGVEVIHPHKMSQIEGTDSSKTKLLSLESSIYGLFPVLHLEFLGKKSNWGRTYLSFGGGYGQVKLTNKYKLTADGTAQYPSMSDYTEKASQYTYLLEATAGYELYFAHATTLSFDIGYRYALAGALKHSQDANTFNGTVKEGDPLLDNTGHRRSIDLGGAFVGLGLRFYFNF